MFRPLILSLLKILANSAVTLFVGLLVYSCYRRYQESGSLNSLGLLIVNFIFVVLYIAKRDATGITVSPWLWLLALAGSCAPLLLRPTDAVPATLATIGNAIQLVGIIAIGASLLSLRRSFGIVPANRGVQTERLYGYVRHPLYASELLWMFGFVIANPSVPNVGLWIIDCGLQFARAVAEERFLVADPVYKQYMSRVRYRLVPRLV